MHTFRRTVRVFGVAAAATLCAQAPAAAQALKNTPTQIPQGSPNNNSFTENIDFADADLDGDFDAILADGGDCCNDQNRIWMNQGGAQAGTLGFFADETATRFPAVLDDSRDVDFVDVDGDGDQDIYVSNTAQITNQTNRFLVNMGGIQAGTAGFFQDQTAAHWINLGINDGSTTFSSISPSLVLGSGGFIDWSCDCVFGDLDNDGDIDLVHTTYGGSFAGGVPSRIFLNNGNGGYEEHNPGHAQLAGQGIPNGTPALWAEGLFQNGTTNATGAFADIADTPLGVEIGDFDADFDIDILQGARNEYPRVYINRLQQTGGTLIWRDQTETALASKATGGGNYEQEMGDFDNDGDLDIYGLNWSGLSDIVAKNNGNGTFAAASTLPGSGSDDNEGDFFDYNNDGNLDIFVTNFSGQDRLYRNDGPPNYTFTLTVGELSSYSNTGLGSDASDVDLDGDYDFLVGNDGGQANVFLLNTTQVADTHAPKLQHLEQAPDRFPSAVPTVVRVAVHDNSSWNIAQFNTTTLEYRINGGPINVAPMVYAGGNVFRGEIDGSISGVVSYQARSEDEHGNSGLSTTLAYTSGACSGATATYCTAKPSSLPGCTAVIGFSGTPSLSAGSGFVVSAGPAPGGNVGLFLYTTQGQAAVPANLPFGFLCIKSPGFFRFASQAGGGTSGVCNGSYSVDFNTYAATQTIDPLLVAGSTVDLQCWYRDPPNPGAANLSNAGSFVLCP
jgi:hypothetical protein